MAVAVEAGPELEPGGAERTHWTDRLLRWWHARDWALWLCLTLLGLTVGELYCNNSWDYPTYLGIACVAIAIGIYAQERRINQRTLTQLVVRSGYVFVLSILLFRPYHARFGLAYSSVELWKGERTSLGAYLLIHGTFLFILVSYLLSMVCAPGMRNGVARAACLLWRRPGRRDRALHLYDLLVRCQTLGYELGWLGMILAATVVVALLLSKGWVLALTLPILLFAVSLSLYRHLDGARRFQTFLVAAGVALTIAVEYIVIKGDIGRMNTVFKFYLQVWIVWGIVAAVALAHLSAVQGRWRPAIAGPWRTILVLLLVGVSLYPVFATYGKVRDRWNTELGPGLDGMAYMTAARYHDNNRELVLEHDRQAITWMQDHIEGSPVIAEANTPLYRWGSRISIYTGLPSVVGWDWHQKQQRAAVSSQVVDWRLEDLRELFNTQDIARAEELLQRYGVGYVYVGELERAYYDPMGLAKFELMVGSSLDVAYNRPPVAIYRVRGSGASEVYPAAAQRDDRPGPLEWLARQWIPTRVRAEGPEKERAPLAGDGAGEGGPEAHLLSEEASEPLMLGVPVGTLPVLRDRGWNRAASQSPLLAVAVWWMALQCVGLAARPLVSRVCGSLPDRGYSLSKGIGLLLVSYIVWLGASMRLFANSASAAWAVVIFLGALSFFWLGAGKGTAPARPANTLD
ncbi:MAG: hypothetical protein FJZ90_15740 [Chloroflexi bacterium]|nr:hypothetical protein [Chloroflexota bacterium]